MLTFVSSMRARKGAVLTVAGFAFAAVAIGRLNQSTFERDARGSVQQCNTECQSKMTDCILACDGVLSCELGCKAAAVRCVEACTHPSTIAAHERDAGGHVAALPEAGVDAHAESGAVRDAGRADGARSILTRDR